ncbi:type II secretion system protein GspL [Yersinia similis]|uniref:General secretion pathway protein L n=1 Tax=Yersinia similis TaxID=367190 RepID=A0A0T9PNG2_9GAMM|nr:type II secretion system protein GspL [Yersinia similis]CNE84833.1 general secretion pathway protein L [Yersinia similis]CNF68143.1 general secretion pathway protein L [Yersinia similis]CNH73366.1 general secretion pathway protein L [Yersinia similis]
MSNIIDGVKSTFTLLIRLGETEYEPIYWYVESQDKKLIRYGKINGLADLGDLALYANDVVKILVPASQIVFRRLNVNLNKVANNIKSIAFSIEQSISSDVDNFHIVILDQDKTFCHVAAIEHALMNRWLSWLKINGISACCIIPDAFALPFFNNEWSVIKIDSNWLVRNNEMSGFLVSSSVLENILMIVEPTVTVNAFSPADIKWGNWQSLDYSDPMLVMAKSLRSTHVNLLSGKYKYAEKIIVENGVFLRFASWFFLLFLVMNLNGWYQGYKIVRDTETLGKAAQNFYAEFLPPAYHEGDINTNFNQYILDLDLKKDSISFIKLLNAVNYYTSDESVDMHSFNFNYIKGEISIDIEGDDDLINEMINNKTNLFNARLKVTHSGEDKFNIKLSIQP